MLSTPAGTVRRETCSLPWLAAPRGQGRFRRALGARTPGALRSKPMVLGFGDGLGDEFPAHLFVGDLDLVTGLELA